MQLARSNRFQAGFTLVELLASIAVLAVIVVVTSEILGTAAQLTTVNNKRMDANDQARMVFDRMANDFARMVRRRDVDYLFWKNSPSTVKGTNDAMYFFTEGASYFDSSAYPTIPAGASTGTEKNSVSLVGYRVNNYSSVSSVLVPTIAQDPSYYQLERLGKALSWDGGAYNAVQPNIVAFLTYPPAGTDAGSVDAKSYSSAFFNSTIWGAYSNWSSVASNAGTNPSAAGTEGNNFNDSADTSYHVVGSQVFRFEYSFQLKDGTMSDKPVMVAATASNPNGIPFSFVTAAGTQQHPQPTDDSANNAGDGTFAVGSRWYDSGDCIGFICLDATPNYAIWHQIGIQDISAVIVTIAVIDKQGLYYTNSNRSLLKNIAAKLIDYSSTAATTAPTVKGDPAYLLDPTNTKSWAYALLPGQAVSQLVPTLPAPMIAQIRLYQRYFYLNSF